MSNAEPLCPCCDSPDTVGYWDKVDANDAATAIIKSHYPDARMCVDCDFVWWPEMLKPHPALSMLRKDGK